MSEEEDEHSLAASGGDKVKKSKKYQKNKDSSKFYKLMPPPKDMDFVAFEQIEQTNYEPGLQNLEMQIQVSDNYCAQ